MTLKELKELLNQVPEDRLDQVVYVAMAHDDPHQEMQSAVQEVDPSFHTDDQFTKSIVDSTVRDIIGIELDLGDAVYLLRS